jgi:hypothetical protein
MRTRGEIVSITSAVEFLRLDLATVGTDDGVAFVSARHASIVEDVGQHARGDDMANGPRRLRRRCIEIDDDGRQCDAVGPWTRCPMHEHVRRAPLYGATHQGLRRAWSPAVAAGVAACARCHRLIDPDEPWQLDHIDGDERPSHRWCNEAAPLRRIAAGDEGG